MSSIMTDSNSYFFISYSRQDADFVNRLVEDLHSHDVQTWFDQHNLPVGEASWELAIRDAIRGARGLILVASPASNASVNVRGELQIAQMYQLPVYPVWAKGSKWIECVPIGYSETQYADARSEGYPSALTQLLKVIQTAEAASVLHSVPLAPASHKPPRNPYKGLHAFTDADQYDFFGRERLVNELVEMFGHLPQDARLLALVGPSGTGKSSVIMASLLPRLKAGALPGSQDWIYLGRIIPGTRPLENLALSLSNATKRSISGVREDLEIPNGRGLHLIGSQLADLPDRRVVLFIDQFEELFMPSVNPVEQKQFIEALVTAVTEKQGVVGVVLTLRADFYDRPMQHPELAKLLIHHQPVLPLSLDELREAIEKPAALPDVGVVFEERLIGDLLFEIRGHTGALPLLQFTLYQLFEQREGRRLTQAAYQQIGGVRGALAKHAEATYEQLNDNQRRIVRALFLRLIEPGTGEQETACLRIDRSELNFPDPEEQRLMDEVIEIFTTQARLLTLGNIQKYSTLEISHEALLREWTRLTDWVQDAGTDIRLLKSLRSDVDNWLHSSRDSAYLFRGRRLTEIVAWTERNTPNRDEVAFIEASLRRERELKRREQMLQIALAAVVVLILLSGIAFFAIQSQTQASNATTLAAQAATSDYNAAYAQRQSTAAVAAAATADRRADEAQSLALAGGANNALSRGQPDVALALALQANRIPNPPPEAELALVDTASFSWIVKRFQGHTDRIFSVGFSPDGKLALSGAGGSPDNALILWDVSSATIIRRFQGHSGEIYSVAFSPDGETALSSSQDKSLILWEVATGAVVRRFQGHVWPAYRAVFSPDGKTILSGGGDNRVILWDVATGKIVQEFEGHVEPVWSVAFSPDGKTALSGSIDQSIIQWDLENGNLLRQFEGHSDTVYAVAFSPDGRQALSGSADRTLILWDIETGGELRRFRGHTNFVFSVAFSPDGKLALSGSQDNTVILWDVSTGSMVRQFFGHTNPVWSVTFSPDSKTALSGSQDNTLILWDLTNNGALKYFDGHTDTVYDVAFGPDATTALSGAADNMLILWDIATGEILRRFEGHSDYVYSVAFSPDGKTAVSTSRDNTLILWDIATGEILHTLRGHPGAVWSVAFSPDGRTILSGADHDTLILWDVGNGEIVRRFRGHTRAVWSVAFSPDGENVLSSSADNTVILWDVATGQPIHRLIGHDNWVWSVAFSPDGKTALSGSADTKLILWDLKTGQPLRYFQGHTNTVNDVAFSPDGRLALSASHDNTLLLWDVTTGSILRRFQGHTDHVWDVDFSPDGKTALSSSRDKRLILWDVTPYPGGIATWTQANRYVPEMTCEQRQTYHIEPECDGQGLLPAGVRPATAPPA